MPLYRYLCSWCGETTDVWRTEADPEGMKPGRCEKCGARNSMDLQVQPPGLQFKGHGFYVTDYKEDKK